MAVKFRIVRLEERIAPSQFHVGSIDHDGGQHYDPDNPSGGQGHASHGNGHGYGHRHDVDDSPPPCDPDTKCAPTC